METFISNKFRLWSLEGKEKNYNLNSVGNFTNQFVCKRIKLPYWIKFQCWWHADFIQCQLQTQIVIPSFSLLWAHQFRTPAADQIAISLKHLSTPLYTWKYIQNLPYPLEWHFAAVALQGRNSASGFCLVTTTLCGWIKLVWRQGEGCPFKIWGSLTGSFSWIESPTYPQSNISIDSSS